MQVKSGLGGRGVAVSIDRKPHPDSHFEMGEMNISKAHDGSFVIKHHMRLKKKHEGKEEYSGGYREPEIHTAVDGAELMQHVGKYYGAPKKEPRSGAQKPAASEPDADDTY